MFEDGAGDSPIATVATKRLIELAARAPHRDTLTMRCHGVVADDAHSFGAPRARCHLQLFAAPLTSGDTPLEAPHHRRSAMSDRNGLAGVQA